MTVGRQWASLGVSPRSSWWSTLRVFVEDSLPDCRYLVSPCTPLCTGAGSAVQSNALACGWRGGSLDLEPLRWGQVEGQPGLSSQGEP